MKISSTVLIFAFVGVSVQDEFISSFSKHTLGYDKNNRGEFFKTFTQKSGNCQKAVLQFDIDTGVRQWSYVEITSPMKLIDTVEHAWVNETFIQSKIDVVNDEKCQIDFHVYVQPK